MFARDLGMDPETALQFSNFLGWPFEPPLLQVLMPHGLLDCERGNMSFVVLCDKDCNMLPDVTHGW